MKATMSFYFISQQYERDYVIFMNVENDSTHTSPNAIRGTHHFPWIT